MPVRRSVPSFVPLMGLALVLGGCGGDGSSTGSGGTVTVPGAPTIGTATPGNASASIAFTAPASNGGAAISSYTATCTAAGASQTASGSFSPISVSGLTNGLAYSCAVTATNSAGTGPASASVAVTPTASAGAAYSTAAVLCPYSGTYTGSYSAAGTLTARWAWTCAGGTRALSGNGLPNHAVGTFPNSGNPNTISAQSIAFSATTSPTLAGTTTTLQSYLAYALNSVKFDPGTGGNCPANATSTAQCSLIGGSGSFNLEALGQTTFDFGVDANNAHVQPTGTYHYHGIPEGLLTALGTSSTSPKMTLVGWAPDGFPVYARYCYSTATDATSAVKVCKGSYSLVTTTAAGRPATSLIPLGTFTQDWSYTAGSGDLDDCNGRTGVTPEFPAGIYYYMLTDTYPYFSRCWKGKLG